MIEFNGMRKKLLLSLPLLGALALTLYLLSRGGQEAVIKVEERQIKTMVYGSGYARREGYVVLKSEVSGYIREILVDEGEYVYAGQPLAIIDAGSLDASIKEIDARIGLLKERSREDSDYLKSLEMAVESAQISMENAKRLLERRERLFAEGLISKESYEQAKTSYEVSKREYQRALNLYEDAKSSIGYEKRALIAQRERLLKERQKYTIRSPINGYVLKRYVNSGDYVNPIQENKLFSIGSGDWEVLLEVDEEYSGLIREGQKVFLRVDAYPGRSFEGKVEKVIAEVDRSRKLLQVKVRAELPEDLPNNSTVDGNIEIEPKKILLIPKRAYRDGYVILYDGVRRLKAPVKVGREYGESLEVLEGLKPGDRIVLP